VVQYTRFGYTNYIIRYNMRVAAILTFDKWSTHPKYLPILI